MTLTFVVAAIPDRLRTFVQLLARDEYYVDLDAAREAHKRQSLFNVVDWVTGWKIDFIIRKSRAFSEEEFLRCTRFTLQAVPLSVASAEDVVISKLEWVKLAQSPQTHPPLNLLGSQFLGSQPGKQPDDWPDAWARVNDCLRLELALCGNLASWKSIIDSALVRKSMNSHSVERKPATSVASRPEILRCCAGATRG